MSHTRTVSPILDLEVSRDNRWTVFDARTAADLCTGRAATRHDAVRAALGAIAERSPSRLYVASTSGGWSVFHPRLAEWVPLPLTAAAKSADAFAFASDMIPGIREDRHVEVCDVAALAAAL